MDECDEDVLISEQKRCVRHLTLNRPNVLNTLNAEVITALEAEIVSIEADAGTRAVIVTGAGERFRRAPT